MNPSRWLPWLLLCTRAAMAQSPETEAFENTPIGTV